MFKDFKSRHEDLNKGEDMRSNSKMFDNKSKKFKEKTMQARAEERKASKQKFGGSKRSFSDRAVNKMHKASRPTKSKVIVKGVRPGKGGKKR